MEVKRIVCTVTNDLNYDQRMIRICTSLSNAGYDLVLVGRKRRSSKPLKEQVFKQKRLYCFFDKGKLFYAEYNLRLFFYLFFIKMDAVCAIDLDTILPCLFVSKLRNKKRVYDAHELFCEMEEIVSRPMIYKIWKSIERYAVPQFKNGYTIGDCYAEEFKRMYAVDYRIVRNATVLQEYQEALNSEPYILYQGAVNEGRSFETLIPAMKQVRAQLIICGEGNFYKQAQALVDAYHLSDRIQFKGYIEPAKLKEYTKQAYIGITLFTDQGKSNYLSMANRFFDYMHSAVPQVCMAFPEYKRVNERYEISYLVEDTTIETLAHALNELLENKELHARLKSNCLEARKEYCWQEQEKTLIEFYKQLFD
jgi:glycosyltransferase involved in cell wall biosynthesis